VDWLAVLLVGVNVLALVTGFAALVGWFRRWLVKQVSEPVQSLTTEFTSLSTEVTQTRELAQRAHDRIDKLLESRHG
jgi:outer membrane murein-binding lipoprotein Lpp